MNKTNIKIEQVVVRNILYNQKNIHVNIFFEFRNLFTKRYIFINNFEYLI